MFTHRIATAGDLEQLRALMDRAIDQNQSDFLSREQVLASRLVMGIDTQLISDGTYFVVEEAGRIAGCGGWSFRATLYGGDASIIAREPERLDPARDPAKVRAMYTDPDFVRRGVGSLILGLCENAAREAGFHAVELMATVAGVPLYNHAGYAPAGPPEDANIEGVRVPLQRMRKAL